MYQGHELAVWCELSGLNTIQAPVSRVLLKREMFQVRGEEVLVAYLVTTD